MNMLLKRFWYAICAIFVFIVGFILTRTPLWFNRFCTGAVFFCFYPLVRILLSYNKTLLKNLIMIYGETLSRREIRQIADSCMRNIIRMPGDILYYGAPAHHGNLVRDITITGKEHIEKALAGGRGVIGLGAHTTNFLLLTVRLAQSDLPFVVLTRDPDNEIVRNKFREWRAASGVKYIDVDVRDRGVSDLVKALNDNQLVYLIADERRKRNSMVIPFFGKPAYTAAGPAVFSKRTGAPIVPIFIAERDGGLFVDIMPALEDSSTGDIQNDIKTITERANGAIEEYVRRYPEQWFWMRPRWKI